MFVPGTNVALFVGLEIETVGGTLATPAPLAVSSRYQLMSLLVLVVW